MMMKPAVTKNRAKLGKRTRRLFRGSIGLGDVSSTRRVGNQDLADFVKQRECDVEGRDAEHDDGNAQVEPSPGSYGALGQGQEQRPSLVLD